MEGLGTFFPTIVFFYSDHIAQLARHWNTKNRSKILVFVINGSEVTKLPTETFGKEPKPVLLRLNESRWDSGKPPAISECQLNSSLVPRNQNQSPQGTSSRTQSQLWQPRQNDLEKSFKTTPTILPNQNQPRKPPRRPKSQMKLLSTTFATRYQSFLSPSPTFRRQLFIWILRVEQP